LSVSFCLWDFMAICQREVILMPESRLVRGAFVWFKKLSLIEFQNIDEC